MSIFSAIKNIFTPKNAVPKSTGLTGTVSKNPANTFFGGQSNVFSNPSPASNTLNAQKSVISAPLPMTQKATQTIGKPTLSPQPITPVTSNANAPVSNYGNSIPNQMQQVQSSNTTPMVNSSVETAPTATFSDASSGGTFSSPTSMSADLSNAGSGGIGDTGSYEEYLKKKNQQQSNTSDDSGMNSYLQQILNAQNPSDNESRLNQELIDSQTKLNNLGNAERAGEYNLDARTASQEFTTGAKRMMQDQYNNNVTAFTNQNIVPLQARIALEQSKRQAALDAAKTGLDQFNSNRDFELKKQTANKPVEVNGELFQQQADGSYKAVAGTPKQPSMSDQYGTGSIGEYNFAKSQGYKGSFSQYQNEDANRKMSIARAGASNASGLTNYQEVSTFNRIADKFSNSPLMKAADRTPVLQASIDAVKANPKDAAQQLNLSYAYIQALDTYQSAVREGELTNLNSIDSSIGKLKGKIQKITNGQVVRPEIALQIASASKILVDTINTASNNKAKQFAAQANTSGVGKQWNQYTGGFNAVYNQPNTNTSKGFSPKQMQLPNGMIVTLQADGTYK